MPIALTISDGGSCAEQKCPRLGFGAILSALKFIYGAADWADNRGGNDPFGVGGGADTAAGICRGSRRRGGMAACRARLHRGRESSSRCRQPEDAKGIGGEVPTSLLLGADRVIQCSGACSLRRAGWPRSVAVRGGKAGRRAPLPDFGAWYCRRTGEGNKARRRAVRTAHHIQGGHHTVMQCTGRYGASTSQAGAELNNRSDWVRYGRIRPSNAPKNP